MTSASHGSVSTEFLGFRRRCCLFLAPAPSCGVSVMTRRCVSPPLKGLHGTTTMTATTTSQHRCIGTSCVGAGGVPTPGTMEEGSVVR